ncbi:transposase [Burkholderia guangdongensis]|uniref:transposase n=1 Tax=Burkholderia guangdongensis TaxID=1792500 RepID=UPI0015C91D5B|nr:transposase [Burkholderia guangdongensis]
MFFDELNDEEWNRLSTLIANEPIRLNRRGRPRADTRVVANAVLWILTTGEPWSKLPGRYPSGPTCRRRFEEWLADGTMLKMIDTLTAFSGRTFAYIPPPPVPVAPVAQAEPAPDNDRLRGVFWQNPESWQLPIGQSDAWPDALGLRGRADHESNVDDADDADDAESSTFTVPGAAVGAQAGLRDPHASATQLSPSEPQIDTYRGYTLYCIAQPVQNLMYRAWAEIVLDDRRIERSGLIGPRFTDAESAEQYALDWARRWIDRHGVRAAPARASRKRVQVIAGLSALAVAESNIRRFVAQRRKAPLADGRKAPLTDGRKAPLADSRNDSVQAERRELMYRVG